MTNFYNYYFEANELSGGMADGKSIQDIADKHKVSVDKIKSELAIGKKVEMEHTTDSSKATEVAMDHLWEIPDYYTRLDKMEKDADS